MKENLTLKIKKRKNLIIVECVVLFCLAVVAAIVISQAWLSDSDSFVDTVKVGTADVIWCDESGNDLDSDTISIGEEVFGGQTVQTPLYVKNNGTTDSYLRVKVEVFSLDGTEWVYEGNYVAPNVDYDLWLEASDGYFYYNSMTDNLEIENAKFGCVYSEEIVLFAGEFSFNDPLPDSLLGKQIKVVFTCDTIQERNEAVSLEWSNAPSEWFNTIGIAPSVFILSSTSSSVNGNLVDFSFDSSPLTEIDFSFRNSGIDDCYLKLDIVIEIEDNLVPSGIISFSDIENFTFSDNDGKFYYDLILVNNSENINIAIEPILTNIENLNLTDLNYNIRFYIETLSIDEGTSQNHPFFDYAPDGWLVEVNND